MIFQLMPLHWGQVTRKVTVDGGDIVSGILSDIDSTAEIDPIMGKAIIKKITGSGAVNAISSSDRQNGVGGSSQ